MVTITPLMNMISEVRREARAGSRNASHATAASGASARSRVKLSAAIIAAQASSQGLPRRSTSSAASAAPTANTSPQLSVIGRVAQSRTGPSARHSTAAGTLATRPKRDARSAARTAAKAR